MKKKLVPMTWLFMVLIKFAWTLPLDAEAFETLYEKFDKSKTRNNEVPIPLRKRSLPIYLNNFKVELDWPRHNTNYAAPSNILRDNEDLVSDTPQVASKARTPPMISYANLFDDHETLYDRDMRLRDMALQWKEYFGAAPRMPLPRVLDPKTIAEFESQLADLKLDERQQQHLQAASENLLING